MVNLTNYPTFMLDHFVDIFMKITGKKSKGPKKPACFGSTPTSGFKQIFQ